MSFETSCCQNIQPKLVFLTSTVCQKSHFICNCNIKEINKAFDNDHRSFLSEWYFVAAEAVSLLGRACEGFSPPTPTELDLHSF